MKKILKKIKIIFGIILLLLVIIIVFSFSNHKIQEKKEAGLLIVKGKMVEVNGHEMHVFIEGNGNETLVFMSGGGTCIPSLDFKSLYSILSKKYKIAVIEKAGYGFSETTNDNREIEIILEETREALKEAGLTPPYVLFPHSMSGIEALYWAQLYPEEIVGIIGLDMAVPEAYKQYQPNILMITMARFGAKIGITRFFPKIANDSSAIKYGTLTEKEKLIYKAAFYKWTLTKSMISEIHEIKANAEKVEKLKKPDVSILLFISKGEDTGWDSKDWISFQTSYIESLNKSRKLKKYILLSSGHYVHDYEYEYIAEESMEFIEAILSLRN